MIDLLTSILSRLRDALGRWWSGVSMSAYQEQCELLNDQVGQLQRSVRSIRNRVPVPPRHDRYSALCKIELEKDWPRKLPYFLSFEMGGHGLIVSEPDEELWGLTARGVQRRREILSGDYWRHPQH